MWLGKLEREEQSVFNLKPFYSRICLKLDIFPRPKAGRTFHGLLHTETANGIRGENGKVEGKRWLTLNEGEIVHVSCGLFNVGHFPGSNLTENLAENGICVGLRVSECE